MQLRTAFATENMILHHDKLLSVSLAKKKFSGPTFLDYKKIINYKMKLVLLTLLYFSGKIYALSKTTLI